MARFALLLLVSACYVEVPDQRGREGQEPGSTAAPSLQDTGALTAMDGIPLAHRGQVERHKGDCEQEPVQLAVGSVVQAFTCDDDPGTSLCQPIPERLVVVMEPGVWSAYVTGCVTDDRVVVSWISVGL